MARSTDPDYTGSHPNTGSGQHPNTSFGPGPNPGPAEPCRAQQARRAEVGPTEHGGQGLMVSRDLQARGRRSRLALVCLGRSAPCNRANPEQPLRGIKGVAQPCSRTTLTRPEELFVLKCCTSRCINLVDHMQTMSRARDDTAYLGPTYGP